MMTAGYLILGEYCPGIQPYLTRGNATLNDKQIFWKNRLIQLAVITTIAATIFAGICYNIEESDDPVYTAFCKHIAKHYGANALTITVVLVKACQSDNELTRQFAYHTIAGFNTLIFTCASLFKMFNAYMHYRNPNGIVANVILHFTPEA